MLIEMHISSLAIDHFANSPVVILKDETEKKTLPIWIGLLEASAIAMVLEGIELSRPMTHDLMKNILQIVDVKVEQIVISDLMDNTYYAKIHIRKGEEVHVIDARPSDSMALALRTKAKIMVDDKVLEKSKSIKVKDNVNLSDEEKMKEFLEGLDPDSFKYKM